MNRIRVVLMGAGLGLLAPLSGQTHFNPDADGDHMIGMQDILVIIGQYGSYDLDEDNIFGAFDGCPDQAGTWENGGCPPQPCEPVMFDGYTYNVVELDGVCWFAENLRSTHYANGEEIAEGNVGSGTWEAVSADGVWCDFNLDPVWSETYGLLYSGFAVLDERGVCPGGWHVPSDLEWMGLEGLIGMDAAEIGGTAYRGSAAAALKDVELWNGTDDWDWSGLPAGFRSTTGAFLAGGSAGGWWTASDIVGSEAWFRSMHTNNAGIQRTTFGLSAALSVRCVKN